MSWYSKISSTNEIEAIRQALKTQYTGLELDIWQHENYIELARIELPKDMRDQGIGTQIIQKLQDYAKAQNLPLVVSPEADKNKKQALDRFYRNLGFINNKGRNMDYTLSSPFRRTMYWRP